MTEIQSKVPSSRSKRILTVPLGNGVSARLSDLRVLGLLAHREATARPRAWPRPHPALMACEIEIEKRHVRYPEVVEEAPKVVHVPSPQGNHD